MDSANSSAAFDRFSNHSGGLLSPKLGAQVDVALEVGVESLPLILVLVDDVCDLILKDELLRDSLKEYIEELLTLLPLCELALHDDIQHITLIDGKLTHEPNEPRNLI